MIFIQNVPFISIILKLSAPPDYQGVMESWESTSGLYVIDPFVDRQQLVTVYYDMETENEGWTVQIVISFSLFLSISLSFYFYPPSVHNTFLPFLYLFISFLLSYLLWICHCIRFSVYNIWLLYLNFSFYYFFLFVITCRFLEQKTHKSKVYIADLRGLLLKNLNFIE